jgi:hypothetical protein
MTYASDCAFYYSNDSGLGKRRLEKESSRKTQESLDGTPRIN